MAKFFYTIPDELTRLLNSLGNIDDVAPKMIESGLPIVQDELVRRSEEHRDTGEMIASIKPTKTKKTDSGYVGVVRPTGKDSKGVRNMEKMAYLEYGTSVQPPTPVLTPAVASTEKKVVDTMQEVFNEEMWITRWNS